jgi:hypothetical protein
MTEVTEEATFHSSIDDVWKVVGDFGGFVESMGVPVQLDGEGIGQTRTMGSGPSAMVEKLEERDEAGKRVVYSIVSSPLPITNYRSTMQLTDEGGVSTKLVWTGTFDSEDAGGSDIVRSVYQGGIGALKGRFGG